MVRREKPSEDSRSRLCFFNEKLNLVRGSGIRQNHEALPARSSLVNPSETTRTKQEQGGRSESASEVGSSHPGHLQSDRLLSCRFLGEHSSIDHDLHLVEERNLEPIVRIGTDETDGEH